jgi:16S rRNA (cytosine967-C5)-methyltransferase
MAQPSARDIVFHLLSRWTTLHDPPFLPDRSHPDWAALSPRDRAFAFDLLTAILRWRGTLDAVIGSRLKQPLEHLEMGLRVALWMGACQILFQSTADYAAVDTAVTLARRVNPQAAGLVNAVLRAITRLEPRRVAAADAASAAMRLARHTLALDFATDLRLNTAIFPDPLADPVAHLAAVRSHPPAFVRHLLKILPDRAADILLRNNQRPIVTLRADVDALDVPAAAQLTAHAEEPRFLVAGQGWSDALEQLVASGRLSPQDPTAAKPVRRLAELAAQGAMALPTRALDYCAGLGTKTIQLARAFPAVQVTATDLDNEKLHRLHARVQQLKLANVETRPLAEIENQKSGGGKIESPFDLILLDVPCSNTGVFAKRVQSRWRWTTLDHAALGALQLRLLRQASRLLSPAGILLYSTCSIDPAENQDRIRAFLSETPALRLLEEQSTLPSLNDPFTATHDGGYFATLGGRRPDSTAMIDCPSSQETPL